MNSPKPTNAAKFQTEALPKPSNRRLPHVSRTLRDAGFHEPIPLAISRLLPLQSPAHPITCTSPGQQSANVLRRRSSALCPPVDGTIPYETNQRLLAASQCACARLANVPGMQLT